MSKRSTISTPALAGTVVGLLAVGLGAWYLKTHELVRSAPLATVTSTASVTGNIAVPPNEVAAAAAATTTLTREQAVARLMSLPELQAWGNSIEKRSSGKTHGGLIEYDPAPRDVDGTPYYQFTFVENSEDSVRAWQGFLISTQRGEILVEDDISGELLTLERWRKEKQPLQRASAQ
jgi:hypothetical protein